MVTVTAVKGVVLLLFIGFVDLANSVAVGFLSAEELQKALDADHFACKVTPTNNNQVNVTCNKVRLEKLPALIVNFQQANISELQLIQTLSNRHTSVLKEFAPFYCDVIRLSGSKIHQIQNYVFVNVVGLRELYFANMPNLKNLPLFGYLPSLKLLSLKDVVISQLTDHSTYETWRPLEYKERIFRGVESLQTLILTYMNIVSLTKFDLFDLPNLKYIEPARLRPHGFFNDVRNVDKMDQESRYPRIHPQRHNSIYPFAVNRKDLNMLQTTLHREMLDCDITRSNQVQIDVLCDEIPRNRLSDVFNLIQFHNIRKLRIVDIQFNGYHTFPVFSPISCEIIELQGDNITHIDRYAFVNVAGLRQLHFVNMPKLTKLPIFGNLPNLEVLSLTDMIIPALTDYSGMNFADVKSMPIRTFKGAGSLQRLILHNTIIRQIQILDTIDLPNLKYILPERLAPPGFKNGQGLIGESRKLIIKLGMPAPARARPQAQDAPHYSEAGPSNKRPRMNNRMHFVLW